MGRKKRKVSITGTNAAEDASSHAAQHVDSKTKAMEIETPVVQDEGTSNNKIKSEDDKKPAIKASNYAMTSHSGEIIEADNYVSDGSEDEDDFAEVVLSGSKVGLMRRGFHQPLLVQPTRQWVRSEKTEAETTDATDEQQGEKDDVANMDPTERAAQLLAEKQRKLEEAKDSARRLESEENAGRDPCLFSKRTAFDIRFDQIDDKPWERGAPDLTDFFNYGLAVDDWLEYAQQQLTIRQELTDASKQKRPPDPNIVPVSARKPKSQTPKVAVASSDGDEKENEAQSAAGDDSDANGPGIGPAFVKKEEPVEEEKKSHSEEKEKAYREDFAGPGGVWGAPDAVLARLIEEQEQGGNHNADPGPSIPSRDHHHDGPHNMPPHGNMGNRYDPRGNMGDRYDPRGNPGNDMPPPPREPPSHPDWGHRGNFHGQDNDGGPPGPNNNFGFGGRGGGRGRGRGGFGGRFNNYGGRGGRGQRAPPGPPQRRGGRGGRGDYRRPPPGRDDQGYYGGRGY